MVLKDLVAEKKKGREGRLSLERKETPVSHGPTEQVAGLPRSRPTPQPSNGTTTFASAVHRSCLVA